ncbi:MAG TPA: hypothetical protein VIG38_07175 [Hyphomicrobium sp.]|jgi:hypothetical protein
MLDMTTLIVLLLSASGEPLEAKTYTYRTAFACRSAERMQRDAHVKLPEGVTRKVYCRRGR